MMRTAEIARHLLEGVAYDGGATVDPMIGERVSFDHGYVVGGVTEPLVTRTLTESAAERFVSDHESVLSTGNYVVGSWEDSATGTVYLDVSQHVDSEREALEIAASRGEKAVWDCERNAEVRV